MHEQPIYPIMAAFPICAEQDDIGSGFGMELEKPSITGRDYSDGQGLLCM